ncbi:MAG: DUF5658 family protein [Halorientalis sp.]
MESEGPAGDRLVVTWPVERDLTESHAVLWSVILVASVFDILTTMRGIALGLQEGNAVARAFMATYGTPGIGLLKFSALVALAITWWVLPDRPATVVLTGFAVLSVLTIGLNALTLAGL